MLVKFDSAVLAELAEHTEPLSRSFQFELRGSAFTLLHPVLAHKRHTANVYKAVIMHMSCRVHSLHKLLNRWTL